MISTRDQLIAAIYRAGAGLDAWSVPLRGLADLTGSRNSLLHAVSVRTAMPSHIFRYDDGDLDHDAIAHYADFMQEVGDPRVNHCAGLVESGLSGFLVRDHDFIDERAMKRHPYYCEMLPLVDLRYALIHGFEMQQGSLAVGVSIQRTARQGLAGSEETRFFESVQYHFVNALKIQSVTARLRARTGAPEPGVIPTDGVGIINSRGDIYALSEDLENLLRAGTDLCIRANRLGGHNPRVAHHWQAALRSATSGAPAALDLAEAKIRIHLVPMVSAPGLFLAGSYLVVIVEQLAGESPDPIAVLARRYALSPTEMDIAARLWRGHSLREISEQRSVSVWTVRTQMKSIFDRTGVRSQRELIGLISRLGQAGTRAETI